MMDEGFGCSVALVVGALILGLVAAIASDVGRDHAHEEFMACRTASAQAKSDSIAVALRPECKRWLFPESVR